jgi:hypothetical protein
LFSDTDAIPLSQHKFVAKKYCPPSIPDEFFQDATTSKPR